MPESSASIAKYYNGWEAYQELLIKAIAPLTAEQLTLRAAPHLRSIGEDMLHIIAVRARWFHKFMGEGGDDIAALMVWDRKESPARSAAELVDGFDVVLASARRRSIRADAQQTGHPFVSHG